MEKSKKQLRIIISGGGTGGHIFPAISIANALKARMPQCEILFVGAETRMEMERVPAAGYKIVGLPVQGFDRSHMLKNFRVAFDLLKSLCKAKRILKSFAPDIAIGVGGYASGPMLWMAARSGVPIVIQEQNSYAGVTNKLLAKQASKICVAYEGMERFFPAERIVLTGNPVRATLEAIGDQREEALQFFGLTPEKKTILILGGSLGARSINRGIQKNLDKLLAAEDVQVIWQTGRIYHEEMQAALQDKGETSSIWCSDFITRMDYAYAAADLVVSRAGAGTISELCLVEKAVILVPSPNVAEDHQTQNALALSKRGAALMVKDKDVDESLVDTALSVLKDDKQLETLKQQISLLAKKGSAETIVDEILSVLQTR